MRKVLYSGLMLIAAACSYNQGSQGSAGGGKTVPGADPHQWGQKRIKVGNLFGKQTDDILKKINGESVEMNTPDQALQIFTKYRDKGVLHVEVERAGQSVSYNYVPEGAKVP